jgi:hypothetical protein
VVANREDADDDVREPPRDGRERLRRRRRVREVDAAVGMHRPAAGDRLPEVLVVGESVEARPQLLLPVEVELVDEVSGEVRGWRWGAHGFTLSAI